MPYLPPIFRNERYRPELDPLFPENKSYSSVQQNKKTVSSRVAAALDEVIKQDNYSGRILKNTVKEAQEGWSKITASANQPGAEATSLTGTAKNAYLAMQGQFQILTSYFTAFGKVNGEEAERLMRKFGASPGLARATNIGVNFASGYVVPMGTVGKLGGEAKYSIDNLDSALFKTAKWAVALKEAVTSGLQAERQASKDESARMAAKFGFGIEERSPLLSALDVAKEAELNKLKFGMQGQ